MDRETPNTDPRSTSPRTGGTSNLRRLDELDDYKVAEGEPDIRGWDVKTTGGAKIGEVKELLVDTAALKVRYLEVELDRDAAGVADRRVLVPIGAARLDDDHDDVFVPLSAADLAAMPAHDRATLDRTYETSLRDRYAAGASPALGTGSAGLADRAPAAEDDFYAGTHYDDRSFFGRRRQGREERSYLARSTEER